MSDFFSLFQQNLEGIRSQREPKYERSFLERVFAPFQAPQEALFKFTLDVAEDGFQVSDIWSAISHGARFFNPWSNVKPIDPNEVRQVFFGDEAEGVLRSVQNLAISLLYDPLLFAGFLKGVGMAGRAANTLEKVMNPAALMVDGMKVASERVLGPLAKSVAYRVLGEEKAQQWAVSLAQNWFKRHAGIDDELVREAMARDQRINKWRERGYHVIKKSQELGGQAANRLLAEALELDAAYISSTGGTLSKRMQRDLNSLNARIDKLGIDRDLFWEVYRQFRDLDDEIGRSLMNAGAISETAFESMRGTHLRRIYLAHEAPEVYAKRIEDLGLEPELRVHRKALWENLNRFRDELRPLTRVDDQSSMFTLTETLGVQGRAARYFEDGTGRFNVKAFVDDFDDWVANNSNATVEDALAYVNDVMLAGVKLPPEMNKALANYLTDATFATKDSKFYADLIRGRVANSGVTWRTYAERLNVVANRIDLPEVVREAMGEILEAAPRMAAEVTDAAKVLETRRFFDTLAGVKRIDDQAAEMIRQAERLGFEGAEAERLLRQAADHVGVDFETLVEAVPKFLEEGVGMQVGGKGTRWVSFGGSNRELGHIVQLPNDPSYGSLAGGWVSPAVATMLRHVEGVKIGNEATRLWHKMSELIARGVSHFKVAKVVLDPTAQFRNFVGNAVLMDMSGTSPFRLDLLKIARDELVHYARTGEMGKYLKLADDAGIAMFQTTFSAAELKDFARSVAIAPDKVESWKDVFTKAHAAIQRSGLDPVDRMAKAFEFNERLFKMTVFIDRVRRLESNWVKAGRPLTEEAMRNFARQAGAIAEQALFNYADVPYMVEMIRKYGIVPFITFPFKAVPFVAETLYKHPHRVLRYDRMAEAWNEHLAGSSVDAAREIEALPEHIRDSLVLRMPFKDAHGRPLYLDISYFLPWAVIADLAKSAQQSEGGGFREGILTPPAMVLVDAIRRNQDSLGRPITDPNRTPEDNFMAIASFLWKFIAPPSAPGGSRAESIGRAMQAMATTAPERLQWSNFIGAAWRGNIAGFGFPEAEENIKAASGRFFPQSQAQMQSEGILQALGFAGGLLFGGLSASDQTQALYQERVQRSINRSEAYRQMAAIRVDGNLSIAERNRRIRAIRERLAEQERQSSDRVVALTRR